MRLALWSPTSYTGTPETPPVVDQHGYPILVEKPPEFLHASDERQALMADAIRGLELKDEIPQHVPLEINAPALPPEPQPMLDAARQEMGGSTVINTPVLDILPDAEKGLLVPEPVPPAPPAWQLPNVELPPGMNILEPSDTKPALEGVSVPQPHIVEVVTVQPEASPPAEPVPQTVVYEVSSPTPIVETMPLPATLPFSETLANAEQPRQEFVERVEASPPPEREPAPAPQSWLPPEPPPFVETLANNEQQPHQSWTERVEASPPPPERDSSPAWTDRVAPETPPPPPEPHHEADKSWVEHVSSPAPETHHSDTSPGHDNSSGHDSGGVGI